MLECSQDANFWLSCYAIELTGLVRIVRRIVGVELSERSLKRALQTLRMSQVRHTGRVGRVQRSPISFPATPILRSNRRLRPTPASWQKEGWAET